MPKIRWIDMTWCSIQVAQKWGSSRLVSKKRGFRFSMGSIFPSKQSRKEQIKLMRQFATRISIIGTCTGWFSELPVWWDMDSYPEVYLPGYAPTTPRLFPLLPPWGSNQTNKISDYNSPLWADKVKWLYKSISSDKKNNSLTKPS